MSKKESNGLSKTVEKALDILDLYCEGHNSLTLKEIMNHTNMTKTTAFRLIKTLEEREYLSSSKMEPGYVLGPKSMHLSSVALTNTDLQSVIDPILKELRDITGETTSVFVERDGLRICIGRYESKHPLRNTVYVGQVLPIHAGAYGRILLMGHNDDEIMSIIKKDGLEAFTQFTITDEDVFLAKIYEARKNGYAITYSERTMGTVAIASPIYNCNNEVIAALGCSGPRDRFTEEKTRFLIENVKKYSKQASMRMGWFER